MLRRTDDVTYGKCEQCGREIRRRLLEARPSPTLCIDCKPPEEQSMARAQQVGLARQTIT